MILRILSQIAKAVACSLFLTATCHAQHESGVGIIDCHVHLWSLSRPEGIAWIAKDNKVLLRDYVPAALEPIAEAHGVLGVVVVQAGQSLADNQWNLDITAHNTRLYRGVVGNLSTVIGTDEFKPLFEKLCEDGRYVGYRLSGRYEKQLTDAFYRDLKLTAEKGKTVDVLLGGYSLEEVAEIAARVPNLQIILDHLGGVRLAGSPLDPKWIAGLRAVAEHTNVHCKVSALFGRVENQPAPKDIAFYSPALDVVFECFGEDRIVYGSDWPVSETTGDYAAVLKLTREYFDRRGRGVLEKLFFKNAVKFYRVPDLTEPTTSTTNP